MSRQLTEKARLEAIAEKYIVCTLFRADLGDTQRETPRILSWSIQDLAGISITQVGSGTVNGFSYVDLRFVGTTTAPYAKVRLPSSTVVDVLQKTNNGLTLQSGITVHSSVYTAFVGGNPSGVSVRVGLQERAANDALLIDVVPPTSLDTADANVAGYTVSKVLTSPSVRRVSLAFFVQSLYPTPIDFTLRIAQASYERRAQIVAYNNSLSTINWQGIDYFGVGALGQINAIESTTEIKAARVSVSLSGIPLSLIAVALNEQYQNSPAQIWNCFFDKATMKMVRSPVLAFDGVIDNMGVEIGETGAITVDLENIYSYWSRPNGDLMTDANQQAKYPGDKGLQYVGQEKTIYWGRPNATTVR